MQSRWRSRSFALLLACATATAQEARVRAVFAASEHRDAVPGIAWLCEDYLPGLPSWPAELDPLGAFSVTVTRHGVRAAAADVAPPSGAVAIGAVATSEDPNAPALLWRCGRDGREEADESHSPHRVRDDWTVFGYVYLGCEPGYHPLEG